MNIIIIIFREKNNSLGFFSQSQKYVPEADEGFFEDTEDSEIDVRGVGVNPEFEDWSLVFTTSKGHVIIAPIVPPVL